MASTIPVMLQEEEKLESQFSFEEWLSSAPDSRITEWVDGEIIEMPPVLEEHDAVSRWLIRVLGLFLEVRPVGEVRAAPFVLKLQQTARGREPDLMFVATKNAARLHPTYVEGPADAVWEIVSPESVGRDRGDKFVEYEAEGIPEYWLIDRQRQQLELYRLGDDGRYRSASPEAGKYKSAVIPGFYIRAEWLWSKPLPPTLAILREFGLL